jgi:hypothetical protein
MKGRTGRVNLSKLCLPTSERKCPLFKVDFGAQFECVVKCMPQNRCWPWIYRYPGVIPGLRKARGRRLPGKGPHTHLTASCLQLIRGPKQGVSTQQKQLLSTITDPEGHMESI